MVFQEMERTLTSHDESARAECEREECIDVQGNMIWLVAQANVLRVSISNFQVSKSTNG